MSSKQQSMLQTLHTIASRDQTSLEQVQQTSARGQAHVQGDCMHINHPAPSLCCCCACSLCIKQIVHKDAAEVCNPFSACFTHFATPACPVCTFVNVQCHVHMIPSCMSRRNLAVSNCSMVLGLLHSLLLVMQASAVSRCKISLPLLGTSLTLWATSTNSAEKASQLTPSNAMHWHDQQHATKHVC